ncbi:MAG: formylglycine-generating enzyme family protein, partial [Planctomycetota bacterium]
MRRFTPLGLALLLAALAGGAQAEDEPALPSWAELAPEQLARAQALSIPAAFENAWGMRFVLVPEGRFAMGSRGDEAGRHADERAHAVTLSRSYYLQVTEVTNAHLRAWREALHRSMPDATADARPAAGLTYADAVAFAAWLSEQDGERTYRLPREAEWEWACRAGSQSPSAPALIRVDDANGPVDAGSLPPNAWGFREMQGNLWEWCADWYAPHSGDSAADPAGPESGLARVLRGGSWRSWAPAARVASRSFMVPTGAADDVGVRLAVTVEVAPTSLVPAPETPSAEPSSA